MSMRRQQTRRRLDLNAVCLGINIPFRERTIALVLLCSAETPIELLPTYQYDNTGGDVDLGTPRNSTEVTMRNSVQPDHRPNPGCSFTHSGNSSRVGEGVQSLEANGELYGTDTDGQRQTGSHNVFNDNQYKELTNTNQYNVRKMASQTLIDVALMMANISQLRTLFGLGEEGVQYYKLMLSLVIVSLVCQVIFAIILFGIWVRESDFHQQQDLLANLADAEEEYGEGLRNSQKLKQRRKQEAHDFMYNRLTTRLNYASMFLVFIITVVNMFITGFSIKIVDKPSSSP